MANEKLTALTALTDRDKDDLVYIVDDPSGTPTSKKITVSDLQKPITEAAATLSSNAALSPDLSTFNYKEALTLNANITSLEPSNGLAGNYYKIALKQGATGGTLTLADDWATSTAYALDDLVLVGSIVYLCTTAHTSDASDFENDIANWRVYIICQVGVIPLLSTNEDDIDYLILFVVDDSTYQYSLSMIYAP